MAALLKEIEPDAVLARRRRAFVRRVYYGDGKNDHWSMDQHDKWGFAGLWLHLCVDAVTGYIIWLEVWWTNSNPRLITSYYLNAVRRFNGESLVAVVMHFPTLFTGLPLLTQSDPGSENFGVANVHTTLRQTLDPFGDLQNSIHHLWKGKHMNIKSEIQWSHIRRNFSPSYNTVFEQGVHVDKIYNPDNPLQK